VILEGVLEAIRDSGGWILAAVLALVAIFRDALKSAVVNAVRYLGNRLYQRLAGSRLLRRRSLGRYRDGLMAATERIQVPFRENRPLFLRRIYVALRIAGSGGADQPRDAWQALQEHRRVVVTGPPGAGKSMLLRHMAAGAARREQDTVLFRYLPVLLELHRLGRPAQNGGERVEDYIVDAMARAGFPRAEKFVKTAVARNWLLFLLDGLDEVPSSERSVVAGRLTDFLEQRRDCPVVVTCRSAVYRGEFDAVCEQRMALEPFEDQQIQQFLESWSDPMPEGKSSAQLMAALREQPQLLGAARNPLLLTIITHLYSDSPTYVLPRSRAEFYQQSAGILLEQWQERLGHSHFDGNEKRTVLSELALRMQVLIEQGTAHDRRTIRQEVALARTAEVMPRLGREPSQATDILREIVERSGLLLSIDGGTRYAFAHLTFQEYFAAEALLSQGTQLLERFGNDRDAWREVVVLWCGLVTDCTQMVESVDAVDRHVAMSCVAEARSLGDEVAKGILEPVIAEVIRGRADDIRAKVLGAVAADIRPRGNHVLATLVEGMEKATDPEARLLIASALASSNRSQAAEVIVRVLPQAPQLAAPVVRLGDLAVPFLLDRGIGSPFTEGRFSEGLEVARLACRCLAEIGTPDAALALVNLLWRSRGECVPAAWGIAKVIENPVVERKLATRIGDLRIRSSLDWIWRPFVTGNNEAVCALVGFAAEVIQATTDERDAIAAPDARICVALCAMSRGPIDKWIGDGSDGQQLIGALNAAVRDSLFGLDDEGRVVSPYVDRALMNDAWTPFVKGKVGTLGQLFAVIGPIVEERTRRKPGATQTNNALKDIDRAHVEVLERIDDFADWKRLVLMMPLVTRRRFLARSALLGEINRETWSVLASKDGYDLDHGAINRIFTIGLGAMSVVALYGAGSLLAEGASLVEAALVGVSVLAIGMSWRFAGREEIPAVLPGPKSGSMRRLVAAVFSPFLLYFEIDELGADTRILQSQVGPKLSGESSWKVVIRIAAQWLPMCAFFPGLLWLAGSAVASQAGLLWAVIIFTCVFLLESALVALGIHREDKAQTPLLEMFSGEANRHLATGATS
jgi:energy-coupling factor transporter ATP-binding protein EcfA2